MPNYRAPLADIRFALWDVLDFEDHYACLEGAEDATRDVVDAIVQEGAKFAQSVLAPLNAIGDREGCRFHNGEVSTPEGFREAYQQYVQGGWPAMAQSAEAGGEGLPESLGTLLAEINGTANWAWSMYPGLSQGAMKTIEMHGSEDQRRQFLGPLVSGRWTGTMCLTESHCGTDLGLLKTRAEPRSDGSYRISGQKIFISAGEHDMADNIVHIVLARLPDAPPGTGGISLFIVPKYHVGEDAELGERNAVHCGSIEHKMGINGSATCVLNFDAATGYLIGPPNRGLACMFTYMNTARIGTALQGLAHAELAFQGSLDYARERLQMRSLSGAAAPSKAADPIIVHPDVRRMLLTQKAFAEGNRLFLYHCARLSDRVARSPDAAVRESSEQELSLLTPIAKAFMTETGFEAANLGVQVFGGHGYIREWGMEQNVRDARIAMLYEGTTGVQAIDLLGRKVLGTRGRIIDVFSRRIRRLCARYAEEPRMSRFVRPLMRLEAEWHDVTRRIGMASLQSREEAGAAAVDYLMYAGYIVLAWCWAEAAATAMEKLDRNEGDTAFLSAKLFTAQFYFERLLPRTRTLVDTMTSGADNLMALDTPHFAFH